MNNNKGKPFVWKEQALRCKICASVC